MSSELFGYIVGIAGTVALGFVLWLMGKILSFFTDKDLD